MKQAYFDWGSVSTDPAQQSAVKSFFHTHGFVILTSFCTGDEVSSLRGRAGEIVQDFHRSSSPSSVFTTKDQDRPKDDTYFLSSAGNVSCFLEERRDSGRPAVNKIGHALHDLDDVFGGFSRQEKVRQVTQLLQVPDPFLVQSMYILKGARVGGEVRPHRDATFVRGTNDRCLGFWWALQDATLRNGCLWAVPGSHRPGGPRRRFVMNEGQTKFEGETGAEDEVQGYVALPVRAGDLVMLDGEVVHKSEENLSEESRHAYSIHVVSEGVARDCWLQRPAELPYRPL